MNERIKKLALQAQVDGDAIHYYSPAFVEKFAQLLVEEVLEQVKERAYYTGDRDWSDEVDRPWIQLEFGYGKLAEAQK